MDVVVLSPTNIALFALGLLFLRQVQRLLTVSRAAVPFPKIYALFQPFALPGLLFPTTPWTTGPDWHWIRRFRTYSHDETIHLIPILSGTPGLWTSNMDVGRQIVGEQRSSFSKPLWSSQVFLTWGMNLAAADGQMWRKHRRVVGPAFGPALYKLVWKKTAETYRDMVETEGWNGKEAVDIPVVQKITLKLAFLIICSCGFGFPSAWDAPPQAADGAMPVQETLKIVAETHLLSTIVPKWLMYLPIPRLRAARSARERLHDFMQEQMVERKALVAAGDTRADAFTMLVKANQDESSKYPLDDDELIGNVFLLMFAGHETSAHTLAATLGLLAVHEEAQKEVLDQIISVVGHDRDPTFDDYSKLNKVLATFYEASRMFPAGHTLIREATEDTVLTFPNPVGEDGHRAVHISKGTQIMLDMIGAQYNPRYINDPGTYKPSRWYGLPPDSDLFTAFSVGPRACIGRKFATVEATCFLTLLLRDWQVLPILRDGETKTAWAARVLDARIVLTLGVADFPVRLVRRKW
ncbi:cytochrome P450 [Mycena sanguinolenta]|nr:cytochrome P450 [Mycena sanguinolenta]